MSDNPDKKFRRSSILKKIVPSIDLQDDPTVTTTFTRNPKRISFSRVNNVKEFAQGNDGTIWVDSYEKESKRSLDRLSTNKENTINMKPLTLRIFSDIEGSSSNITSAESNCHTEISGTTSLISHSNRLVENSKRKFSTNIPVPATKCRKIDTSDMNFTLNNGDIGIEDVSMEICSINDECVTNLNATRFQSESLSELNSECSQTDSCMDFTKLIQSNHSFQPALVSKTCIQTATMEYDDQSVSNLQVMKKNINQTKIFDNVNDQMNITNVEKIVLPNTALVSTKTKQYNTTINVDSSASANVNATCIQSCNSSDSMEYTEKASAHYSVNRTRLSSTTMNIEGETTESSIENYVKPSFETHIFDSNTSGNIDLTCQINFEVNTTTENSDPLIFSHFLESTGESTENLNDYQQHGSMSITPRVLPSDMSSQNNTDDLCNLEPEQLKQCTDKNFFFNISMNVETLSETKVDLVNDSNVNAQNEEILCFPRKKLRSSLTRCQSIEYDSKPFVKADYLLDSQVYFNVYDKFVSKWPTVANIQEAHKKRLESKKLDKYMFPDQNVNVPDIEDLLENKDKNEVLPKPIYTPIEVGCIYPMLMSLEFILNNKIRTEYTEWKYYDDFFHAGTIILRFKKIPSIKFFIQFDANEARKADELNRRIIFDNFYVKDCPIYLKRISPINYLLHKQALAKLPLILKTMCANSDNLLKALDEISEWFNEEFEKVSELVTLVHNCNGFVLMENGQCYIELTLFNHEELWVQEINIKIDKIDAIGARSVYFEPKCGTTDDFKNLPTGLPFLRSFVTDPKSFILR